MILIILHELWHFVAARKSWVKVLEFGIGIPPKICKLGTDKKWTVYTLNLIPLGWFCRLKWEDPNDKSDFHAKDSFISAKFWNKLLILAGGVLANLLVAWLVFSSVFAIWTKPISVLPENAIKWESHSLLMPTYSHLEKEWFLTWERTDVPLIIDVIMPDSIADSLWLKSWDIVMNINDIDVNAWNIWTVLKDNIGQPFIISYKRNNKLNSILWECPKDNCILWIVFITSWDLQLQDIKFPIYKAAWMWVKEIWAQLDLTFSALWKLWKNLLSFDRTKVKWSLNWLTWPVWVIKFWDSLLNSGGRVLYLAFAGLISLALAIFNILPIPALDGGRIIWVLIQKIGKLKPEKYFVIEWYINTVFFILLMILWVYIIFKDLVVFRWIKIPFIG
jgi:regulator of sigma E protease